MELLVTVDDNYAVTDVATTPPRVICVGWRVRGVRSESVFWP
jgi:hypothetical protein